MGLAAVGDLDAGRRAAGLLLDQLADCPEVTAMVVAMAGDEPVCSARIEFLPGTSFASLARTTPYVWDPLSRPGGAGRPASRERRRLPRFATGHDDIGIRIVRAVGQLIIARWLLRRCQPVQTSQTRRISPSAAG
jgi:hypothetical protein